MAYEFRDHWVVADTGEPPKIEFRFGTARFYIRDRALYVLRFIKNMQTKLPASHFKGKAWYDSLTGKARFDYVPLMREAA